MKTPAKLLQVILLAVLMFSGASRVAQAAPAADNSNRVALVIGNSNYKAGQPLANPANDASDFARKLRELGFNRVVLGVNLDRRAMRKALREFRDALRPGDVALAYYAGHGVMVGGVNYMVPIDAKLEDEDDVKDDAMPMDDLLKMMEESRTRTNILMLDACRDNPFKLTSRTRATKWPGLSSMQDIAGEGTQIIYAARPGKVAIDGTGRNGVFTTALLTHIDTPGLTLNDLVGRLADDVRRLTNNKQQPWAEGLLTGTFVFNPSQTASNQLANTPQQREDKFWEEAKAAENADGYQAYIEQYPNGRYAGLARAHIKRFGGGKVESRPVQAAPTPTPAAVTTVAPKAPSTPPASAPQQDDARKAAQEITEAAPEAPKDGTIRAGDTSYIGNFAKNEETGIVSGSGRVEWVSGDAFEGEMREGLKQGKGTYIWKNGQRYTGDWVDDKAIGSGKISFSSGDQYEGEVYLGEPHGQGTFTFSHGDRYVGAWVSGKKNGQGRYLWTNGSYWEGEFKDDKRTENGNMVMSAAVPTQLATDVDAVKNGTTPQAKP